MLTVKLFVIHKLRLLSCSLRFSPLQEMTPDSYRFRSHSVASLNCFSLLEQHNTIVPKGYKEIFGKGYRPSGANTEAGAEPVK